jgi:hypothetical protein
MIILITFFVSFVTEKGLLMLVTRPLLCGEVRVMINEKFKPNRVHKYE